MQDNHLSLNTMKEIMQLLAIISLLTAIITSVIVGYLMYSRSFEHFMLVSLICSAAWVLTTVFVMIVHSINEKNEMSDDLFIRIHF